MRRERTFATAERVAAAVAARLACLHEDGAPPSSSSTAALVELYRSVAASGDDASVDGVTARARKELSKLRFALPDRSDAQLAAALALSGDWTHSAAILHLVRAHLASLTKGAANDPTDGEVAKAFTRVPRRRRRSAAATRRTPPARPSFRSSRRPSSSPAGERARARVTSSDISLVLSS